MVEKVTPGLGGVSQILGDREDQRIFWGLNFLISGSFWVGKFWHVFFGVACFKEGLFRVFSKTI